MAIGVEIAGPRVFRTRVLLGLSTLHLLVAVAAPFVKIISARGRINFVFGIIGAVNLDNLAGLNLGAALVGEDFRFTLAHDQLGFLGEFT